MAKKAAKTASAARSRRATPGRTSAARDTASTGALGKAAPHAGAASGDRVSDTDITGIGASTPMEPAELVDGPAGPEPELTALERKRDQALATGQAQPNPTMAPRAGATAPDRGPIGRAHQPLQVLEEEDIPEGSIKVEAIRLGEYAFKRRRPTDVFFLVPREGIIPEPILETSGPRKGEPKLDRAGRIRTKPVRRILTPEEQFSPRWMRKVGDDTPTKLSTSGDVMPRGSKGAKTRASDARVI